MSVPAQTYNSLVDDIRAYLERGNTSDTSVYDQIPRLIMMGQLRLTKESKTLITTNVLQNTLTVGNPIVAKPALWRNVESFSLRLVSGLSQPVFNRLYSFCTFYWPNPSLTGTPIYYADADYEHWIVVPTPDYAYPIEVLTQEPTLISDLVQTNFFTQYAYDVLLHACLLEAYVFLKDANRMQAEQTLYDRLLQGITFEQDERKSDDSQGEKS